MPRILVIKPSSLGDIVHGLQVMQAVAAQVSDVQISWVVRDRFAGLVQAAPFVQHVHLFRRKEGWRGLRSVCRELAAGEWDLVLDMQGLLRSGLMTAAAKVVGRAKWGRRDSREGAGLFYRHKVDLPPGPGPWHAIDILKPFATVCGAQPKLTWPLALAPVSVFPWSPFFGDAPAERFVIFTDSRGPKKEWPHFGELTRLLWQKYPAARIAWCAGGAQELPFAPPEGQFLNLTGCPFAEMLALARQDAVFIGNDSGPMHLSAAVGNRVLALFGPTPAARFGPYPLSDPRHHAVSAPGGIMRDLTPEVALAGVNALMARR